MREKMEDPILVTRSSLPPLEEYVEMLKPIWDSAWLTNMGAYHQEFKEKLKEYMDVPCLELFVNGHMADISMRAKLRGLKDTTGQPVFKSDMQTGTNYTLDGSPMNFPRNGAFDKSKALMISGDFSQLVYSIRQDITFKIFDQGVIQDPATKEIIYNLMQNDMVALRAVMRLGWEIPNPINAIQKDKAKRCPFALLKTAAAKG